MTDFRLEAYDYHLPPELIAQVPLPDRDQSRLMILEQNANPVDSTFNRITELTRPGDLMIFNNTKVFPARLIGHKPTGGRCEVFLLDPPPEEEIEVRCLIKSSRRPKPGQGIVIADDFTIEVTDSAPDGGARAILRGRAGKPPAQLVEKYGLVPLPPYIKRDGERPCNDRERYQTVYAEKRGAVAAPTAGLHFTPKLLEKLKEAGVATERVTLHVGYGTFAPVKSADIRRHDIHQEYMEISRATSEKINQARSVGARIWAVGTTTVRAVESATGKDGMVEPGTGWCRHYIYPGYRFRLIDNLITNFHLPESSLLFLVSALAGRERILEAYQQAVNKRYRFFSYGDAMAIITRP